MDPLGRWHTFTYDAVGQLQGEQDAKGQRTTHAYSGRREEIGRLYADATRITWTYDAAGQLVQMADWLGLYTRTYDAVGQLRTVNGPGYPSGHPFTYSYDSNGNRSLLETFWGRWTYSYDARDQLSVLTDPGYASPAVTGGRTTWQYDARGLLSRQDNPNKSRATYTYDAVRRVLQIRHSQSGGTQIERAFYTYDALGRPTSKDTQDGTHNYTYDAIDQLLSEKVPTTPVTRRTWTYDAAFHRKTQVVNAARTTYTYDAADQLNYQQTGAAYTTYSYDPNGSTLLVQANPDTRTTYSWDTANRLQAVLPPSNLPLTFLYRYDDLRQQRLTLTWSETMLWDQNDVLAWIATNNGPTELFSKGQTLGRAVGTKSGGVSLNRQFHQDALGTEEDLTLPNQTDEYNYLVGAWGTLESANPPTDNPSVYLGGLGYWRDPDLGLYYIRARWLDPTTGRWLSVDPVEGELRYNYVANQPTVKVDSSGLQSQRAQSLNFEQAREWLEGEWNFWKMYGVWTLKPGLEKQVEKDVIYLAHKWNGRAWRQAVPVGEFIPPEAEADPLLAFHFTAREKLQGVADQIGRLKKGFIEFERRWGARIAEVFKEAEQAVAAGVKKFGEELRIGLLTLLRALGLGDVPGLLEESTKLGWSLAVKVISGFRQLYRMMVTSWETFRQSLPPFLANIAPPIGLDFAKYIGGFFVGLVKALWHLSPPGMVVDFFLFIKDLIANKDKGVWNYFKEYITGILNGFADLFTKHLNLSASQRGETAGNLLVAVIAMIVALPAAIQSGAKILKNLAGAIKTVAKDPKVLLTLPGASWNRLRAFGAQAKLSLDKVISQTKAQLSSIMRSARRWPRRETSTSISNLGQGFTARNAAFLDDFPPGSSAFSGVYDPKTGNFQAFPSGETRPKSGEIPEDIVPRRGGHGQVNTRFTQLTGSDPGSNVGFTMFLEDDGSIGVAWRSGLNARFPNGQVPLEMRPRIIEAIADATGRAVRSR